MKIKESWDKGNVQHSSGTGLCSQDANSECVYIYHVYDGLKLTGNSCEWLNGHLLLQCTINVSIKSLVISMSIFQGN